MRKRIIATALLLAQITIIPAIAEEGKLNSPQKKISIIQNRSYHGNDVQDVKNGDIWTAIIRSNDKYIARNLPIYVSTVRHAIIDDENGPPTGKAISSHPDALFLLRGLKIKEGMLDTAKIEKNDKLLELLYNEGWKGQEGPLMQVHGEKAVTLTLKKVPAYFDGYTIQNPYQIVAEINDKQIPLTRILHSIYGVPSLIWSGDLNSDGYPDFVFDLPVESASGPVLYLSKVKNGSLSYYEAASRITSGC